VFLCSSMWVPGDVNRPSPIPGWIAEEVLKPGFILGGLVHAY